MTLAMISAAALFGAFCFLAGYLVGRCEPAPHDLRHPD
jgi:hypothetical protein